MPPANATSAAPAPPSPPRGRLVRYWSDSRAPRYSLLFALPLLVAYETLAAMLGASSAVTVRNGADVIIQRIAMLLGGTRGPLVFGALVLAGCTWLVIRDARRSGGGIRGRVLIGMLVESALLAAVFGIVVGLVTVRLLDPLGLLSSAIPLAAGPVERMPVATQVMLSLGAGLYEELVFRVALVGGLAWAGRALLGWTRTRAAIIAVILGALAFSAIHYVGPYGDPLEAGSFTFRAVAGVFLSGIYVLRGFGIAAWTHALYDLYLVA